MRRRRMTRGDWSDVATLILIIAAVIVIAALVS